MKKHIFLFAVLATMVLCGCKKTLMMPYDVIEVVSVDDVTFTGATISCNYDLSKVPVGSKPPAYVHVIVSRVSPATNNNLDECYDITDEESGTIVIPFKGLQPNTKYYVRPYIVLEDNLYVRYYGEEMEFVTEKVPGGGRVLDGEFSVSDTKKVRFTSGNLQYVNYGKYWQIAAHQYDCIGNGQCYQGRDLFGWGDLTGSNASVNNADYLWTEDWGSLFDDEGLSLRTLKRNEWAYLLGYKDDEPHRPNADSLIGVAMVGLINGIVLLPDNWVTSEGLHFKPGSEYSHYLYGSYSVVNSYTLDEWQVMEAAGAVFLPFTVWSKYYDNSLAVDGYGYYGDYWSSSIYDLDEAWCVHFYGYASRSIYHVDKYEDYAVRLVMDVN
ncbi:MAG: DUF1566 domain-containing protein [Bacteroidales bacterium]|nr:DUF1566 domain-containing protein [Bacteroidales bacterium]